MSNPAVDQAEGYAELGLFQEAWDIVESLPPEGRVTEAVIAVRLLVCAGLEKWQMGRELAKLTTPEHSLKAREAAGRFWLANGEHLWAGGTHEASKASIKALSTVWPEGRELALRSSVMGAE